MEIEKIIVFLFHLKHFHLKDFCLWKNYTFKPKNTQLNWKGFLQNAGHPQYFHACSSLKWKMSMTNKTVIKRAFMATDWSLLGKTLAVINTSHNPQFLMWRLPLEEVPVASCPCKKHKKYVIPDCWTYLTIWNLWRSYSSGLQKFLFQVPFPHQCPIWNTAHQSSPHPPSLLLLC